jgi:hypothetical protein
MSHLGLDFIVCGLLVLLGIYCDVMSACNWDPDQIEFLPWEAPLHKLMFWSSLGNAAVLAILLGILLLTVV